MRPTWVSLLPIWKVHSFPYLRVNRPSAEVFTWTCPRKFIGTGLHGLTLPALAGPSGCSEFLLPVFWQLVSLRATGSAFATAFRKIALADC